MVPTLIKKSNYTQATKRAIRDGVVTLMAALGFAALYRAREQKKGPLVRIVVFHDVPDALWFESMIKTLAETYAVITPQAFRDGQFDCARINVLITFDDGYRSWTDVAMPILKKYSLEAVFFVSSALIDVAEDPAQVAAFMENQLHISPRPALSWSGVHMLTAAGHTIGGHARTHANLTELTLEQLRHEVISDKETIEAALKNTLTDFAYPFGTSNHVNADAAALVAAAGYTHAYTAISGFAAGVETLHIPRMCIESDSTPQRLKWWVEGAYDLFNALRHTFTSR